MTRLPRWMRTVIVALLAAALLSACATSAPPEPPVNPEIQAAETAQRQGRTAEAARIWERIAVSDAGGASSAWLRAADNWWLTGDETRSKAALLNVSSIDLAREERALDALLRGEIALAGSDLDQAGFFLSAAGEGLASKDRQRLSRARGQLELLRTDPDAALLSDIAALIDELSPLDVTDAMQVLQGLERVSSQRLEAESLKPTPLGQWAALTVDLRSTLVTRSDLLQAAGEWATLNPLHPVDEQAYLELAWQYGQRFTAPGRIAVLLPTEGSLAAAGAAIRDGLVSAWLENPTRSELTFLPVGEDPASAVNAYRQAEREGYQWAIGPLRRESVDAVAALEAPTLPGLLLNWPDQVTPQPSPIMSAQETTAPMSALESDFFSLSLSQEAEAKAVARRMLQAGHQRTILLLSSSSWGARTEAAFMDEYLAGGGDIVSLERFSARDADHSAKLTSLLQIQDGRDRRRRLQSLLNLPLEFEDSRRDDFGAFFMAVDPALGRQLKPQLRFFDAGSKPVYAMSRVYSGKVDTTADADLNGIVIPATRWALRDDPAYSASGNTRSTPALSSLRDGAFGTLYALGRDAWNVLPWLDVMRRDPAFAFPGLTGDLAVGPGGRLNREPVWALFRRGRPEVQIIEAVRQTTSP